MCAFLCAIQSDSSNGVSVIVHGMSVTARNIYVIHEASVSSIVHQFTDESGKYLGKKYK
jgi:hypothetical protein